MRLDELRGRRVALLGMGIDVRAALPAIVAAEPDDVVVVDDSLVDADHDGLPVVPLTTATRDAEVLVRSPGFPRYTDPIGDAIAAGAMMTTPVDLWIGSRASRGQRVVMITGTKGKSTTTDLVGHLAGRAGLRVGIAGNLGIPVFSDGWDHDAPIVAIEVSSYQASDLHHVPEIAVLTSLAEDHLDWHGSFERYRSDKLRVVANDGRVAQQLYVPGAEAGAIDATRDLAPRLVAPPDHGTLPRHRVQNATLAATVVEALGAPRPGDGEILDAAARSLPARLAVCAGPGDGLWIDDALATNPTAAAAGLAWARSLGRPTIVLLGGADRGVDRAPLVAEIDRWPTGMIRAVTLPDNGAALAAACGVAVIDAAETVADAVAIAAGALAPGGTVLFSPSAPTPPSAGTWKLRSESFRESAAALR